MKLEHACVKLEVYDFVLNQVRDQVGYNVDSLIFSHVRKQVWHRVREQCRNQVRDHIWDQGWYHFWDTQSQWKQFYGEVFI